MRAQHHRWLWRKRRQTSCCAIGIIGIAWRNRQRRISAANQLRVKLKAASGIGSRQVKRNQPIDINEKQASAWHRAARNQWRKRLAKAGKHQKNSNGSRRHEKWRRQVNSVVKRHHPHSLTVVYQRERVPNSSTAQCSTSRSSTTRRSSSAS